MDTTEQAAGLQAAIAETLGPVRAHLRTIEDAIEAREAELRDLRELRATALKMIRAADPNEPRPGPKSKGDLPSMRPEMVERVKAAIEATYGPGEDIIAGELSKRSGLDKTTAARGVRHLHDQGVLRLDRKKGNANLYRLTNSTGRKDDDGP